MARAWVLRAVVLGAAAVGLVLSGREALSARREARLQDFRAVARRAMQAVAHSDWAAFRREAAPEIVIGQYTTVFPQDFTEKQLGEKWPGLLFPSKLVAGGDVDAYYVVLRSVSTRRPLRGTDRRAFLAFCGIVGGSWTTDLRQNWMSVHARGEEVPELIGPAVGGKYASDIYWRIELSRDTGAWKVSRLVLEMH